MVDEDKSVRWMLAQALGAVGYAVLERSSAEEALTVVNSHRGFIDLLVTDLMMPRMKGLRVAERVVRLRPGTKILITSSRLPDDAIVCRRVREAGIFLAKPFSLSRFFSRVRAVLALDSRR